MYLIRGRQRWKFGRYQVPIGTQKIFSGRYLSEPTIFNLASTRPVSMSKVSTRNLGSNSNMRSHNSVKKVISILFSTPIFVFNTYWSKIRKFAFLFFSILRAVDKLSLLRNMFWIRKPLPQISETKSKWRLKLENGHPIKHFAPGLIALICLRTVHKSFLVNL